MNARHRHHREDPRSSTAVLQVRGLSFATEKAVVERALSGRPGVLLVEANPVGQTATVAFDPDVTSLAELEAALANAKK